MDQVDNIIFQNLISLGWEKDDDVQSLKDLEVSTVAKLLVKCLNAIKNEDDLPQSLPHNMSQRFRTAAKIAESIKNLGYGGDLGYQSILYYNEVDIRKIFTFLIEKLPKDAPTLSKEKLGKANIIKNEASRKLKEILQRPWVPPHCSSVARRYRVMHSEDISPAQYGISQCCSFKSNKLMCHRAYNKLGYDVCDSKSSSECESRLFPCLSSVDLFPTLLNVHSELMGKNLGPFCDDDAIQNDKCDKIDLLSTSHQSKYLNKNDLEDVFQNIGVNSHSSLQNLLDEKLANSAEYKATSAEPVRAKMEELLKAKEKDEERKLSALTLQISDLQEEVARIVQEFESKKSSVNILQNAIEKEKESLGNEEKKLALLSKTASLTSDPENNLKKLEESLKANKNKEEKLLKQWLDFKKPLEEELEEATLKLKIRKSKQTEIENEISDMKRITQTLLEEAKFKETLIYQLKEEKAKLNKGVNRSVYTKQILDISAKVQKQKQEVRKILNETRVIQKEINTLTGKLQRTFAVVEDKSFKAATANERARQIYRSVITIHEEFGALVDITRETGSIQRETADLQQQLNSEKSKNIEDNLKRLQEDFNNLKMENSALRQSLRS